MVVSFNRYLRIFHSFKSFLINYDNTMQFSAPKIFRKNVVKMHHFSIAKWVHVICRTHVIFFCSYWSKVFRKKEREINYWCHAISWQRFLGNFAHFVPCLVYAHELFADLFGMVVKVCCKLRGKSLLLLIFRKWEYPQLWAFIGQSLCKFSPVLAHDCPITTQNCELSN